jgi:glycosyltransferase involved in cell wall biosynthesis
MKIIFYSKLSLKYKKIFIIFLILFFLITNNIYKNFIPKISIYMPIFNKDQYLLKSIKSIQMQSLKDIEIIAVNDYSNDNSFEILNKISKKDPRIKVINNTHNHGLLYSRAMGILHSSGKYLMNVDPDDELNNNNDLEYLYNIINSVKVDIISFGYLENNTIKLRCQNINKTIIQPKLFNYAFNSENNFINDFVLWNKLIKRSLLIKVFKIFKKRIYSNNKWNYGEDTIWSILLNKYAKSMFCLNRTIYLYQTNNESLMNNRGNIIELKNRIYIFEMYTEILTKKKELKFINAHILEFINVLSNENLLSLIKKNTVIKKKVSKILLTSIQKYNFSNYIIEKINEFIKII